MGGFSKHFMSVKHYDPTHELPSWRTVCMSCHDGVYKEFWKMFWMLSVWVMDQPFLT